MQQPIPTINLKYIHISEKPVSYDEQPELSEQHLLEWLEHKCKSRFWELYYVAVTLQFDDILGYINADLNLECLRDTRQWLKDNAYQHWLEDQRQQALDDQAEIEAQRYG